MIYKRSAFFCFLLLAATILPIVNEREFSLMPSVMAQSVDTKEAEANRLLRQGIQQFQTSQFREALQSWEKALQIYREIKNPKGEAASLNNLGTAYGFLGKYQKAIEYQQQSLVITREIKDRQGEVDALGNLGIAYGSLGQYQKAIEYQQETLAIAREIKDRRGEANSLGNLGIAYDFLRQYQKAIEYQQQSLAIKRKIGDRQGEANSLGNLGDTYYSLGQYQKAIEYHQQALIIAKEIGKPRQEAYYLRNLGNTYHFLGQYQKSISFNNQSLVIARKIMDKDLERGLLLNLGVTYYFLGQDQVAKRHYEESLSISKAIKNKKGEAFALGNLGLIYNRLGQYQKALEYHEQDLAIQREVKNRQGEGQTLNNIGTTYLSLKKYEQASEYFKQSLIIAKEVKNRLGESRSLQFLGIIYFNLGQSQKAIDYQRQSLVLTREINSRHEEAFVLNHLGTAYRDNNQPAEAIKNLEASLNILLDMRSGLSRDNRQEFLAANERTVITLVEVLIQQNQPEKAFQWLNLATTADLANYNRLINAQVANPEAQKAIDNWKTNNQQLEAMRQQLQTKFSDESARQMREFEAKVNKQAETIAQKYPEVAELFETKPTDIAQLQQNIAPDTLVIQPVPLRDKIALFLLTKDKLIVIESNTKADKFNQLVNQYRNQLADRKNADYLVTSSKLYDILIRPIEQQIKTNSPKNLAIIATDQLRYIPFESLYDSKTEQYLLQKYPISYLTRISTANISNSPSKTAKNLNALALANPKPTNQELKGTEKEAENLLKIFPQSETYLGEKATLDTFKTQASRFSILHLGTHGCFELAGCPNLKMQANTILFANNQQYNIADAALLGLKNTELITLSACQTAKEANANGQEISGLAYVLERAGAKSAIASLWNAEDNTSAEIMTQFYQNLQKGMTKSEAMQKAKLSQIDQHPFFWSPFILIGDAQ